MNTYDQLACLVLPLMTAYETDVTEHDNRAISEKPDTPFIHVVRDGGMSSHIYFKPDADWYNNNAEQRYLFAHAYPREIVAGELDLLQTYFDDEDTFHLCDGLSVVRCSRDFAISSFKGFVESVRG